MRRLLKPLWVLLALVFLFEAWLWEHLKPVVGWFVDKIPWDAFKARLAAGIERLPPLATLLVFLVPVHADAAGGFAHYPGAAAALAVHADAAAVAIRRRIR